MDSTSTTLLTILTGIAVVVGGILLFRLHAFLALTLGAMVVGFLTPAQSLRDHAFQQHHNLVVGQEQLDRGESRLQLKQEVFSRVDLAAGSAIYAFVYRPGVEPGQDTQPLALISDGQGMLTAKVVEDQVRLGDLLLTESPGKPHEMNHRGSFQSESRPRLDRHA